MFGIYKKLKEGFKKLKPWLKKTLPKAREVIKTVKPIMTDILNEVPNEKLQKKFNKVNNILNITNDGIEAAEEAIPHQSGYRRCPFSD